MTNKFDRIQKNANKKYIIRNCPAIYGIDDGFPCNYREDDENEKYCYDRTDCVLKRIVEKCKKYIENYNDKVFYDKDDVQILMGKVMLSQSILSEFLDIQEVE